MATPSSGRLGRRCFALSASRRWGLACLHQLSAKENGCHAKYGPNVLDVAWLDTRIVEWWHATFVPELLDGCNVCARAAGFLRKAKTQASLARSVAHSVAI